MENNAIASSQQNGMSERTGQMLSTLVRCILKHINFLCNDGILVVCVLPVCSSQQGRTRVLQEHGRPHVCG